MIKAIKKLKGQQADFNDQYIDYGGINDAFFTAYEVMRKYQKIQEVMDSRPDDSAKSNSKALGEIEVIIYGNDWSKIDLHTIEQKKKKIVSAKDALKDIIPYLIEEEGMNDGKIN